MSSWGSSRSQRSSTSTISPFRSRKSSTPPALPPRRLATPPPPLVAFSNHSVSPSTTDSVKSKENVTVTVRFRPLSPREINKGDEISWYADGDCTVRNEYNSSIAYAFDRVFGPATTTRHVYDIAAQHVVGGAMEGINGTVFAYGVTSSGKTHTMHGEQKSPGIIPLAVKDVFGIIQETPTREFLLRVSYLEIYNEVINDLLDPTGQNLRIREDAQGTFVEGIKEEVVLSPAHALSLIASGEEHRHVGSNNFNLLSSRSHTIFTLTIESSSREANQGEEDVTLSQLHLIDLAGSESSKTETSGLRRKEGSFINKSLLTLGTVISKLTDGKATHIPYRDSKLTRLLQSSLSGHGQISIVCTVTPASSNSEETHNTLKFAHRSKHVEIKASQNKIMDEKSLIKKYQREITSLKEELQQLKRGMMAYPDMNTTTQEDLVNLKLQLEAGQVKLQSRLEEEEQAKAALMGRIQRLTKLILVSTKNSMPTNIPERPSHRRRHSFGEDELAYLPDRKHGCVTDDDNGSCATELSVDGGDENNLDELVKEYKRNKRRGMLDWFKVRKPETGLSCGGDGENSMSPASSRSSHSRVMFSDMKDGHRRSSSKQRDGSSIVDSYPERTRAGDLFSAAAAGCHFLPSGTTITDQMDLLREQVKMLAGEVALSTSSLKRLSEQAVNNPDDLRLKEHMQKMKDEISEKKLQMHILEKRMLGSLEVTSQSSSIIEMSQALSKLTTQLNEKTFELELKTADNRILQEQLQMKMSENTEMQETILMLRQQLDLSSERGFNKTSHNGDGGASQDIPSFENLSEKDNKRMDRSFSTEEACADENTPTSVMSLHRMLYNDDSGEHCNDDPLNVQIAIQAAELEDLKQERIRLIGQKDGLEIQTQKLEEEASYAKELASAAAIELKNLAGEVTRLTYENAKLKGDLAAAKEASGRSNGCRSISRGSRQYSDARPDGRLKKPDDGRMIEDLQRELDGRLRREADLETIISEKDEIEGELRRKLNEAKQREENLENELAHMWVLVAKLRMSGTNAENLTCEAVPTSNSLYGRVGSGSLPSNGHLSKDDNYKAMDEQITFEALKASHQKERKRCKELECVISRLQGDDISGLDAVALEDLQNVHVEAITKICHAKCASNIVFHATTQDAPN